MGTSFGPDALLPFTAARPLDVVSAPSLKNSCTTTRTKSQRCVSCVHQCIGTLFCRSCIAVNEARLIQISFADVKRHDRMIMSTRVGHYLAYLWYLLGTSVWRAVLDTPTYCLSPFLVSNVFIILLLILACAVELLIVIPMSRKVSLGLHKQASFCTVCSGLRILLYVYLKSRNI